jgi:hypothetical protein
VSGGGLAHALAPSPVFAPAATYGVGQGHAVAVGEFTGDQRTDAVVTVSDALSLMAQTADGRLVQYVRIPLSRSLSSSAKGSVATGDLNGDRLLDAAVATGSTIDLFLGGAGTLTAAAPIEVANSHQVEIADLDGDGRADLVVNGIGGVTVRRGLGDGTFAEPSMVSPDWAIEVKVADVTGDGRADVITCNLDVRVFAQDGSGAFAGPTIHAGDTGCGAGLALGDLDGDGRTDIAFAGQSSQQARLDVLLQRPEGGLADPVTYRTLDRPSALEAADTNGDSLTDLVSLNPAAYSMGVHAQAPDHSLDPPRQYGFPHANSDSPEQLGIGDVNSDGRVDVLAAHEHYGLVVLWGQQPGPSTTTSTSRLPPARPPGAAGSRFTPPQTYDVGADAESATSGDFNGDGRTDVAMTTTIGDPDNHHSLFVFYQGVDGSLARSVRWETDAISAQTMVPIAGDFDGDGKTDLVVRMTDGINVFLQRSGTFADRTYRELAFAGWGSGGAAADLDGDGMDDLVVSGANLSILRSQGGGVFGPAQIVQPAHRAQVAIGDLTGDGRPDLVSTWSGLEVYVQQPDGSFDAPRVHPLNSRATGDLMVGDLTGDGRLDVAVAGKFGDLPDLNRVHVLPQLPDGTLGAQADYPSWQPDDLEPGDVDGDGRVDLVVLYGTSVGIFLQQPDGRLGIEQKYPLEGNGVTQTAAVVADFSGDGRLDVGAATWKWLVVVRGIAPDLTASATRYINRAYGALITRPPTAVEVSRWVSRVADAQGRYELGMSLVSTPEFRSRVVNLDADAYLGHSIEPALGRALVDAMAKGSPIELSAVILMGTDEFYARQGGTPEGFADYMFRQVLGRAPAENELGAWADLLRTGYNRAVTALTFLLQPGARARTIDGVYQRHLGHSPDAASATAWLTLLGMGARSELVSAWVISTDEYWAKATA